MKLSDIRREYSLDKLTRDSLLAEPIDQFHLWLQQAIDFGLSDPTAMTIATVDENARPYQRIVLLKDSNQHGLVFYTNLSSRKAQHLETNPNISLHFPWHSMERQVHFTGSVEKLTMKENMAYFLSRPKESQLAALASKQSERISTRGMLEAKFLELKNKFANGDIEAPKFWGGYRVKFDSVEFWQGGEHRLHDRFIYSKNEQGLWQIDRLAP